MNESTLFIISFYFFFVISRPALYLVTKLKFDEGGYLAIPYALLALFIFIVSIKLEQVDNSFTPETIQKSFYLPGLLCFISDFLRFGTQDANVKESLPKVENNENIPQAKSEEQIKEAKERKEYILLIYKFAPILIFVIYYYLDSGRKKYSDVMEVLFGVTSCAILVFLVDTVINYKELLDKDSDSLNSYTRLITYIIYYFGFPIIYIATPLIALAYFLILFLIALKPIFIFILATIATVVVVIFLFNGIVSIFSTIPVWVLILIWFMHVNNKR